MRKKRPGGRRRPSLLLQFGLLSLVLLAAVGAVLGYRLQQSTRERTLGDSIRSAEIIANVGFQHLLEPDDLRRNFLPIDEDRRAVLDEALEETISANGVVRLKIWNREHWIVYSDNPKLVGRWFAGEDSLEDAFAGVTSAEITDLTAPEELEERDFGRLLSVYVPLRAKGDTFTTDGSGEVVGAFEIYIPYQPIADSIGRDTRELTIALAVGLAVLYLALFRLVAGASRRLRKQVAENEFQATHDALTQLPNRRAFSTQLEQLLADSSRQVALALFDVDRFKEINDTLGHPYGDELLCAVARRLQDTMGGALIARLGGDEFVVASPVDHALDALHICDEIERQLDEPIEIGGVRVCVRASIGIAIAPEHGRDPDSLLQHADVAMYVAKKSGTTRRMYSPDFDHHSPERLGLAAEIRGAMASGQITLVYQPKLDIASCEVHGVEALVRWEHPRRGTVSPGEFLPVIENTEMIGPLTWHILDLALAQCGRWRANGVELGVAVNISARTLGDPSLIDNVRVALGRHGVPAHALELEVTESAVLDDHVHASETLRQLRELGVQLAIDDFGTGYASISTLTTLPFNVLKIDMSFISRLRSDPTAAAIVRFTLDLAQQIGLTVVAEGVEDEATLTELLVMGCDHAQGYLISRPMPGDMMMDWMSRWYAATRTTVRA